MQFRIILSYKRQALSLTVIVGYGRIKTERKTMTKYTLAQILDAWDASYGEDMMEEYPGFIQRLSEENASQVSNPDKGTDTNQFGARTK